MSPFRQNSAMAPIFVKSMGLSGLKQTTIIQQNNHINVIMIIERLDARLSVFTQK
jgi:hypothetical protein